MIWILEPLTLLLTAGPTHVDRSLLVLGILAAAGGGVLPSAQMVVDGRSFDEVRSTCLEADSRVVCLASRHQITSALAFALATFILTYLYLACWGLFGERLVQRIQYEYMRALLQQDMAYFDECVAAKSTTQLETDIACIRAGVDERLGICIWNISFVVSAFVVSAWHAPPLAWKMLGLLPFCYVTGRWFPEHAAATKKIVDESVASARTVALESVKNIPIVHAFDAANKLLRLYKRRLEPACAAARTSSIALALNAALLRLVASAWQSVAIWQGSKYRNESQDASGVGMMIAVSWLAMAGLIFTNIVPFLNSFHTARISYDKLSKTITREAKLASGGMGLAVTEVQARGDIRLCDVQFCYQTRRHDVVLDQVSFAARGCRKTAIVGSSGGGKSTIASMLYRLYDPLSGSISLGGKDLRDYDVRSLRRRIAVVEHDSLLLKRSVLENVAYGFLADIKTEWGRPNLRALVARVRDGQSWSEAVEESPELGEVVRRVREALQQAEANDFVSQLEHGMATHLDDSTPLSGGQRQRIALARALARRSDILLLDEATSALDSATEQRIHNKIFEDTAHRTIILITHRLHVLQRFDNIVVLRNGSAVEEGTYVELMRQNGEFSRMIRASSSCSIPKPPPGLWGGARDPSTRPSLVPDLPSHVETNTYESSIREHDVVEPPHRTYKGVVAFFYEHTKMQHAWICIGLLASIGVAAADTIGTIIFAAALNNFNSGLSSHHENALESRRYSALSLATGLLFSIAEFLKIYALESVSASLLHRTGVLSLGLVLRQSMQWHQIIEPGVIFRHLTTDIDVLNSASHDVLGGLTHTIVSLGVGPAIAYYMAPSIGGISLLTVPVLAVSGVLQTRVTRRFWVAHYMAFARSFATAKEAIDAIRVIAAYGLEEELLHSFEDDLKAPYNSSIDKIVYADFLLALSLSLSPIVRGVTYWWAFKELFRGGHAWSEAVLAISALTAETKAYGQLSDIMDNIGKVSFAAEAIIALADARLPASSAAIRSPDHESNLDQAQDTKLKQSIILPPQPGTKSPIEYMQYAPALRLNNVEFAYPSRPTQKILKGLSINIPAGSTCALVGSSGSGKSTILNLIQGFYGPSKGTVIIDEPGTGDCEESGIGSSMALVPQTTMLFNETIAFNMNIGAHPHARHARQNQLVQAAIDADIHHVIERLPHGFETSCGPDGKEFSTGQRQRLMFARALMRQPRLLLLDEPTSALDGVSEGRLQAVLDKLKGQTTIVIVTHRPSLVRRADIAFHIEDGKCVNHGAGRDIVT